MNKYGALLVVGLLWSRPVTAIAQPGGSDLNIQDMQGPPAPDAQTQEPQPSLQREAPNYDPANAPSRVTFVSTSDQPWDVFVDREPICATPCTLGLAGVNFVALKTQERSPIRLDVGYLPPGDVMVSARPLRDGMYAGGIVMTTFAGMSLAAGITLLAVGFGVDSSSMKTAGAITGVAGAVGLYAGIHLMRKALPKVEIGPARPYVASNGVGLAGSF